MENIIIGSLQCELNRKAIKNLHISVLPPDGRVRIAAPLYMSETMIRLSIIKRISWIKKQQALFRTQPRQSEREMVTGESHYLWGQRYRLNLKKTKGKSMIVVRNNHLDLYCHPLIKVEGRRQLLNCFYRKELRRSLPALIKGWCDQLNIDYPQWSVRRMRTKWGSCNSHTGRIIFNSELAKKNPECLEYIVVHELLHLIEPTHNTRFKLLLNKALPDWKVRRSLLQKSTLSAEEWDFDSD